MAKTVADCCNIPHPASLTANPRIIIIFYVYPSSLTRGYLNKMSKKEPKGIRMISIELLLRQNFRKRGSAPRGRPRALTVRRTFSGPRYGRLSCPDSKRRFCRIRAPRRLTLTVRIILCTGNKQRFAFFKIIQRRRRAAEIGNKRR